MSVAENGARLGAYEILSPLGAVEDSRVFAARGPRGEVAFKFLGKAPNVQVRALLLQEKVEQLVHPNLARLLEAGTVDGFAYVVTEQVEGFDLRRIVELSGPQELANAVSIAHGLAGALSTIQRAGLQHGNVKPSSVMLAGQDHATLVEPGQPDEVLDYLHLAPEAIHGSEATAATDLYGLGSTLYFALAGEPAFPRTSEERDYYLIERVEARAPALTQVPERLAALVLRLLSRDPSDRMTFPQVQRELAIIGEKVGLTLTAPRPPVVVLVDSPDTPAPAPAASAPPAPAFATPAQPTPYESSDRTMVEALDLPGAEDDSTDRTMVTPLDLPGAEDDSPDRTMVTPLDLPGAEDDSPDRTMVTPLDLPGAEDDSPDRTMVTPLDLPEEEGVAAMRAFNFEGGSADRTMVEPEPEPQPEPAQEDPGASLRAFVFGDDPQDAPSDTAAAAMREFSFEGGSADRTMVEPEEAAQTIVEPVEVPGAAEIREVGKGVFEIDLGSLTEEDEGELTEVGGFQIISLLGEGGMGQVYKAWQKSLDREVAIKVLNQNLHKNAAFVRSLELEAKAAARLKHANIVGVIEQGTCALTQRKFVAFEFVDGETAGELLRRSGVLPERDALTVALAIAGALTCAEDNEIVHRDIKPDNILIGRDGIPKLADLGLAKRTDDNRNSKRFLGTARYAAPEQITHSSPVDIRSDLYALGLCLYEFVVGAPAYGGRTSKEVLDRKLQHDVADPRQTRPTVSEGVARLIGWLCERDPERRFQSARAATKSIRATLETGEPVDPDLAELMSGVSGLQASPAAIETTAPVEPEADDPYAERPPTRKFLGRGYYDDLFLAEGSDEPKPPAPPQTVRLSRLGRGLYDDEELLSQLGPELPEAKPASEEEEDAAPTMVLSGDMSRAYQFGEARGKFGAGEVYEVQIQGDTEFKGFESPVESALIKVCHGKTGLRREQNFYSTPEPGYPHMIDQGLINDENRYLVLERLRAHPAQRYSESEHGDRIDPALAIDTYLNLFATLRRFHERPRRKAFLLCSIDPRSIWVRMPTAAGTISNADYLERLREGHWTPVFGDLGQAQRTQLLAGCRRVEHSGAYMAPEALPIATETGIKPGTYSPKSDVYALSLILYTHLTGDRPHARDGIYEAEPKEALRQLLNLKQSGVTPISEGRLLEIGTGGRMLAKLLRAATEPDPAKRPNPNAVFEKFCDLFGAEPADTRDLEDYVYDDPTRGLALRQTYFPRFGGTANRYHTPRVDVL
jgi:serine/threonine protein kinase